MSWLGGTLGLCALLYALHRLALFLEARGWLYYLNRRPRVSMIAAVASAVDPTIKHILEAQAQENLEEDESGDPPGTQSSVNAWVKDRPR